MAPQRDQLTNRGIPSTARPLAEYRIKRKAEQCVGYVKQWAVRHHAEAPVSPQTRNEVAEPREPALWMNFPLPEFLIKVLREQVLLLQSGTGKTRPVLRE